MKRELPPVYLALILIIGCIIFRLLSSVFPENIPNISPVMAIAFVGTMYLPARWGWLVGPVAFLISDLAFLQVNYRTDGSGSMFSWWTAISFGLYAAVGGLGLLLARRKSLTRIVCGSVACSFVFYVAANTFSWAHDIAVKMTPNYSFDLTGWLQANTVGLPGYAPTWLFLRNGMLGDLFFVAILLFVLDRALLFHRAPVTSAS